MHPQVRNINNEFYRFEALFNHATMGIIMANSKGAIESVNPFALKLFGYSIEEIIKKPIEVLIPARYHHKHLDHRNTYIHHPRNRPMGVGMDLYATRKDGTEFPVEVSLGNYQFNDDQNVIAFISDITVRKEAEAELANLNNELESMVEQRTKELVHAMQLLEQSRSELSDLLEKEKDLSELKSRFVSMASHEFRSPLSTVLTSAYLIEKYTTTDEQPKRDRHLKLIISSVSMLTDILNDFLSVGKIEEGKIQVKQIRFNIRELVGSTVGQMEHAVKKRQILQYYHSGSEDAFLDPSLLKHIIMNLVSNASKFSPGGNNIEIRTCNQDHQFILSVKDYGMGISVEDQRHLMERFFRGGNAGNIQGTGLGLHIVSKYAELMNGTVECRSDLKKGTEFIITFKIN